MFQGLKSNQNQSQSNLHVTFAAVSAPKIKPKYKQIKPLCIFHFKSPLHNIFIHSILQF